MQHADMVIADLGVLAVGISLHPAAGHAQKDHGQQNTAKDDQRLFQRFFPAPGPPGPPLHASGGIPDPPAPPEPASSPGFIFPSAA